MITREEFLKVKAPFYYVRVSNSQWAQVNRDMIAHWIDAHCGGWTYYDYHDTYVFERIGDRIMFVIWIKGEPFSENMGEVIPP